LREVKYFLVQGALKGCKRFTPLDAFVSFALKRFLQWTHEWFTKRLRLAVGSPNHTKTKARDFSRAFVKILSADALHYRSWRERFCFCPLQA
jgi:hypothetical protein